MAFSEEWDAIYSDNNQLSVWPWSDVVSLVHRHCRNIIAGGDVFEMGCGAGANIPFFRALGVKYFGIEGSPTIVKQLHERYPDMRQQIICGDFTVRRPFDRDFDLVLDRSSITHNNTNSIVRTLDTVLKLLKPGGLFIGVDWFSKDHSDAEKGMLVDDNFTRTDFFAGQFKGVGKVHFSDERHLRQLFNDFEIIYLVEKQERRFEPVDNYRFASWNIVARKPNA